MTWLRLEAAFFSHPSTVAVGFWGSQVFLAGITMSKLHNWRGCIPKGHFTPDIIAHHLNSVTERNGAKQLQDGLRLCVDHGLFVEDATHYVIPGWRKYQPDPTSPERQEKFRATAKVRRAKAGVTVRNGDKRSAASVTARLSPTEKGGSPSALGAGAAPPARDRSSDEVPYAERLAAVRKFAETESPDRVAMFAALKHVRWPE